ncbi:phage portal protein [Ralstonia pseudosolanacearum]|uniref:phage portal protein n=1 Tax=Ralstonia pseudosolanacearum TaxID=1310165 RepID=UPI0023DC3DAF|nr:phage portal protein [Ralstonia pseudosolanacearum]
MTQSWYNEARVRQQGSVVLNTWRAEREAARAQAKSVPVSEIVPGSDAYGWLTGTTPGGGGPISERGAMGVSAVYACVSLIGGAVASLILQTYRRVGKSREAVQTPLWSMLNQQMHSRWSAPVAWEYAMQSLLLHGDAFMRIHRKSRYSPEVQSLEPYHPRSVFVQLIDDRLVYTLWSLSGEQVTVDQDDMIHVPGPGFDGLRGLSQLQHVLRQPVNIGRDGLDQASSTMRNMRPDLVLTQDKDAKKMESADIDKMRSQWLERYGGEGGRNGAPIILTGGMGIKEISITPQDAQLVQTLNLSVEDTARAFGVPPFMIGYTDKTTGWGSGVEQMSIGFVKYTLQRHLVKIEEELNRKINRGSTENYVEFDTETLERGDLKSRLEAARIAYGRAGEPGWITRDEVRQIFNLPPATAGDVFNEGKSNAPKSDPAAAQ